MSVTGISICKACDDDIAEPGKSLCFYCAAFQVPLRRLDAAEPVKPLPLIPLWAFVVSIVFAAGTIGTATYFLTTLGRNMTDAIGYFFLILACVSGLCLGIGLLGSFILHLPTLIREHARRNQR
jgi:hypothetical protein